MLLLNFLAWLLLALGVLACMPAPKADAAQRKPPKAKAAITADGQQLTDDLINVPPSTTVANVCIWLFETVHSITNGEQDLCNVQSDYLGSIRWRLGDIRSLLGNPPGLVTSGPEQRGPLDFIKTATSNSASRLLLLLDQTDGLEPDLAAVKASSAATRTAAEDTASRLSTTNDRLSALDDRLEALDASLADVADAIEAQGPNVGSPTFPGASEANASYVRLAATDSFSDELAQRQESSVMFAAGLITALLVGMALWRSLTGGAA